MITNNKNKIVISIPRRDKKMYMNVIINNIKYIFYSNNECSKRIYYYLHHNYNICFGIIFCLNTFHYLTKQRVYNYINCVSSSKLVESRKHNTFYNYFIYNKYYKYITNEKRYYKNMFIIYNISCIKLFNCCTYYKLYLYI